MPIYKEYTTAQYEKYLSLPFNSNFGFSEEEAADWYLKQAGAQSCIHSYGITKKKLLNSYIPMLKNKLNGGYFMFFAVSSHEGGGAGNFINHYADDTASTGLGCARDDCDYINWTLKSNLGVAMSAPEVLGGTMAVQDTPGEATKFYRTLKNGTIGKYYMPATFAGNSWVWATKWTLAHQGPIPGAYYGNPYDQVIDELKKAGINPFGSGGGTNPDGSDKPNPAPPDNGKPPKKNGLETDPVKAFKKALNAMFKDLYYINNDNMYINKFIKIKKQLNNTYKIESNLDLENLTLKSLNAIFGGKPNGNGTPIGNEGGNGTVVKPGKGGGKKGYYWPFPSETLILTSPMGQRGLFYHQGIDICDGDNPNAWGRPIYAIHSGTVLVSGDAPAMPGWGEAGSMIIIKNDDAAGKVVTYEEFAPGTMKVKKGDYVKGGQLIATSGVSGNSQGVHLHLGISNPTGDPVLVTPGAHPGVGWLDPAPYIGVANRAGTYRRPKRINKP